VFLLNPRTSPPQVNHKQNPANYLDKKLGQTRSSGGMMATMVDGIPKVFGMAFPCLKIFGQRQKSGGNRANGILLRASFVTKKEPVSTGKKTEMYRTE
jgi:hypothetical protein